MVPAPTRGSPRRRRSHAFAGLHVSLSYWAISGAGERTQPSASEHHYESCGDSVVLRESCLRPARATEPQKPDLRRLHTSPKSVLRARSCSRRTAPGALTRCPREAGRRFEAIRQRAGLREIGRPAPVRSQGARGTLSVSELPLGTSSPRQPQGDAASSIPSPTVGHTPRTAPGHCPIVIRVDRATLLTAARRPESYCSHTPHHKY